MTFLEQLFMNNQSNQVGGYGFDQNSVPAYMIGNPSMGTVNPTTNAMPGAAMQQAMGGFAEQFNNTPWFNQVDPNTGMMQQGKMMPMLQAAGTAANLFLGMNQLNQAKDQMNFQRNAWQQQFDLQKSEFDYAKQRRTERQQTYNAMKSRI